MNDNRIHCSMCDNTLSIHIVNNSLPDGKYAGDLNVDEYVEYIYREFGWDLENDICPECLGY